MHNNIHLQSVSPFHADAVPLIDALSDQLAARFGSDGRNSFTGWDDQDPRSIFVVAYLHDQPVACGAIRPLDEDTGEVKRMYSHIKGIGLGAAVLSYLEKEAKLRGYRNLCLETRSDNHEARSFYIRSGYVLIPNYGKYAGREEAVCYGKEL